VKVPSNGQPWPASSLAIIAQLMSIVAVYAINYAFGISLFPEGTQRTGEHARAGRWSGHLKTECGLHLQRERSATP
jgi:hypothetical protein